MRLRSESTSAKGTRAVFRLRPAAWIPWVRTDLRWTRRYGTGSVKLQGGKTVRAVRISMFCGTSQARVQTTLSVYVEPLMVAVTDTVFRPCLSVMPVHLKMRSPLLRVPREVPLRVAVTSAALE